MTGYEAEFEPGDRVVIDISKCPGWEKYGPGAVIHRKGLIHNVGHGAAGGTYARDADGRPVGYAVQMDGYRYSSDPDGNYHTVDPQVLAPELNADEEEEAIASILSVGTVTLPERRTQMPKPKLEVNEVWILEEVLPYEGSWVQGVFADVEVAKAGHKGWRQLPDGDWTTAPIKESTKEFFTATKHAIRRK